MPARRSEHPHGLERLAQALDRVAAELRELVEEQPPVVRECSRMYMDRQAGYAGSCTPAPGSSVKVSDEANAHGFTGIGFHGLRHGAATLLLAAGVPDTVAMRTMGHADTRILARYQDVVSDLQRDAASRMDELLAPKVSPADRR